MAIWDQKEIDVVRGVADSHKCLSCGENLFYHMKEGVLKCSSCGSKYYPEIFDVKELLSSIHEDDIVEDDDSKHEIVCNACGAVVVTDSRTMSTFCAFCGSPAVVTRHLTKEFKPDYIIPFKLTEDEVNDKVIEWAKDRKYLPTDFWKKGTFTKMTGLYVPFWLVDADCNLNLVGGGTKRINEGKLFRSSFYEVKRESQFKMCRVPFDGSERINDHMMEAIEPFDYKDLAPFNASYLQGFYSERYELTADDMANRITTRFRDYMYDAAVKHMDISQYDEFLIEEDNSKAENYVIKYALLPVWFTCLKYRGRFYRIVVNGQTGEVAGTTPTRDLEINSHKMRMGILGYARAFLIAALVAVIPAFISAVGLYLFTRWLMPLGPENYGHGHSYDFDNLCVKAYIFFLAVLWMRTILNICGIGFFGFGKNIDGLIQPKVFMIRGDVAEFAGDANELDKMPTVFQYLDTDDIDVYKLDREVF